MSEKGTIMLATWPLAAAFLIAAVVNAPAETAASSGIFPAHYFATLLSALFGTLVGAFVTSRVQTRKAVVEELRATAAAIQLCFIICNSAIALKKQHVAAMRERYEKARTAYLKTLETSGGAPVTFKLVADFQTLTAPKMPSHLLERQVFEKVAIRGRGLSAALELVNSVEALNKSIEYRNLIIADIYKMSPRPAGAELFQIYFGMRADTGTIDEKFRTSIASISMYTDDCIFFAQQASKDLARYGSALRKRQLLRLRFFLPNLPSIDMSQSAAFLPNASEYEGWMKGFKETRPWYRRMAGKVGSWRPWASQKL